MKNSLGSSVLALLLVISFSAPAPAVVSAGVKQQSRSSAARRAEGKYQFVWQLTRDNYFWRNRLGSWLSWEHRYSGKLYDDDDANQAIRAMLKSLKDPYTRFDGVAETDKDNKKASKPDVVTWRMLPNNIGYIKILTFSSKRVADETASALKAMSGASAYVLDLQNNYGGLVQESFAVFAMFVDEGLYSHMDGRANGRDQLTDYQLTTKDLQVKCDGNVQHFQRQHNLTGNKPLVVLVNGNTCSCSESLAGALMDHGRGELFGSKTFGKGVATRTWQLEGYVSVQIVFARSTLPKGSCINDVGITPTHPVKPNKQGDAALSAACKYLEEKLKP